MFLKKNSGNMSPPNPYASVLPLPNPLPLLAGFVTLTAVALSSLKSSMRCKANLLAALRQVSSMLAGSYARHRSVKEMVWFLVGKNLQHLNALWFGNCSQGPLFFGRFLNMNATLFVYIDAKFSVMQTYIHFCSNK